jgi:hypothetical protein
VTFLSGSTIYWHCAHTCDTKETFFHSIQNEDEATKGGKLCIMNMNATDTDRRVDRDKWIMLWIWQFFHWYTNAASLLELGSYIYPTPNAITVQLWRVFFNMKPALSPYQMYLLNIQLICLSCNGTTNGKVTMVQQ